MSVIHIAQEHELDNMVLITTLSPNLAHTCYGSAGMCSKVLSPLDFPFLLQNNNIGPSALFFICFPVHILSFRQLATGQRVYPIGPNFVGKCFVHPVHLTL